MPPSAIASSVDGAPLAEDRPVVSFTDRPVCSTLGTSQQNAGIYQYDMWSSIRLGQTTYITTSDVFANPLDPDPPYLMGNHLSTSQDLDAADCLTHISMTNAEGDAIALIPSAPGPSNVIGRHWLAGKVVSGNDIYISYHTTRQCRPDEECFQNNGPGYQSTPIGNGLAKLDTTTLTAQRLGNCPTDNTVEGCLTFPYSFSHVVASGPGIAPGDLYPIFTNADRQVDLAKVALSNIEDISQYLVWDGTTFAPKSFSEAAPVAMVAGAIGSKVNANPYLLWDGQTLIANPLLDAQPITNTISGNGPSLNWNPFLNQWLMIHSGGFEQTAGAQAAPALTGPWSSEETLFPCDPYYEATTVHWARCYYFMHDPTYDKNNGQTIYLTFTNSPERIYLHEVTLATPIHLWESAADHTVYVPAGQTVPNHTDLGVAFYASSYPGAGYTAIRRWVHSTTADTLYTPTSPGTGYEDQGIVFYAPTTSPPPRGLAAIHRWDKGPASHVYSSLDLSALGWVDAGLAFYAKITRYHVEEALANQVFPTASAGSPDVAGAYEVVLSQNGQPVSLDLAGTQFSSLTPGQSYAVLGCSWVQDPECQFHAQGLVADGSGTIVGIRDQDQRWTIGLLQMRTVRDPGIPIPQASAITGLRFVFNPHPPFFPNPPAPGLLYQMILCAPDCAHDPDPIVYEVRSSQGNRLGWGTLAPQPPVIAVTSAPPYQVSEQQTTWSLSGSATDPNDAHDAPVTLSATMANGDPLTGSLFTPQGDGTWTWQWTPSCAIVTPAEGTKEVYVKLIATDPDGLTDDETISVTVTQVSCPPAFNFFPNAGPFHVRQGQAQLMNVTFADPDGDPLDPPIVDLVDGQSLSTIGATFTDFGNGTGQFAWPGSATATQPRQPYTIRFRVSSLGVTTTALVTITLHSPTPPVATITDPDVTGPSAQEDGAVSVADIAAIVQHFGSADPLYDLNGDGAVTATDIALAVQNYGIGGTHDVQNSRWIPRVSLGRTLRLYVSGRDPEGGLQYSVAPGSSLPAGACFGTWPCIAREFAWTPTQSALSATVTFEVHDDHPTDGASVELQLATPNIGATALGTPGNLTAQALSNNSLQVSWQPGAGALPEGYRLLALRSSPQNPVEVLEFPVTGAVTSTTLTSLFADTTYTFYLLAVKGQDSSPVSTPLTVKTPTRVATLTPTADTWVDQAVTTATHGSDPLLWSQAWWFCGKNCLVQERQAFLKFDLNTISPPLNPGEVLSGAFLRLYAVDGAPYGGTVSRTTTSWQEGTLTYANRPAGTVTYGELAGPNGSGPANTWLTLNVTPMQAGDPPLAAGQLVAYRITNRHGDGAGYASKEETVPGGDFRPQLMLLISSTNP